MAELAWDEIVDRTYQTGIERGVLYPASGPAVVWNGLTTITETNGAELKEYYYQGLKMLVRSVPDAYLAKIDAITYPDLIDELTGIIERSPGVRVHDGRSSRFHLCYRTRIGNPIDGVDHGYKLHLVYNLIATPTDVNSQTIGAQIDPGSFSWDVKGVQLLRDENGQPLDHISLDSREIDSGVLAVIEAQLYGTPGSDPGMPDPYDIVPALP